MNSRLSIVFAGCLCALGCDRPTPETPTPPPEEPTEPAAPPPRIEVHEWGLIDARGGGLSLHAGHPTRGERQRMRAPVLYAHLPDGVQEARFDLTVRPGSAHRIMEHYPGGGALMPGEPLVWNGIRASRGACEPRRYPRAGEPACRTEDRVCEAQHGERWETADGACLRYGDRAWDHFFYRARLDGAELPLRHESSGDSIRVSSEATLVGMIYRSEHGKVAWVDPPSTGANAELALPTDVNVEAANARLTADLGFHGLTADEAGAFLREWSDLFQGRHLLYWLPVGTLDSIATLEGENLDFKRAILVRVPLS